MKILYIAGESANWVINLCNEMCKQGHTVTCVVQQLDEYDKENPAEEHENLTRINMGYDVMFAPALFLKEMKAKKEEFKDFDIIFGSHTPVTPVLRFLSEEFKIPWGVMLLDIPSDLIFNEPVRKQQWAYWFDVMRTANTVVFNTFVARDEYKKFTAKYFGDDNVVTYATNVPDEYSNSGVDIKGDYVVSACRLTPVKNISFITKAIAKSGLPIKQVVIGRDRGDLINIHRIAAENGIEVVYKDMVSEKEKYELIKNSMCLAYPQDTEYIGGLSPWEGMMIGKPTVCGDYKVLKDLFKDNIYYYEKKDVDSFANVLKIIYHSDYDKELLQKANKYAYKDACFATMASKLLNVFEKVVGENK